MRKAFILLLIISLIGNSLLAINFNYSVPTNDINSCSVNTFTGNLNLNGNSVSTIDLTLNLGLLRNGVTWLPTACTNCGSAYTYPIQITNLQTPGVTSNLLAVSDGVYTIVLSNGGGLPQNIQITYDVIVDCSVFPGQGFSTLQITNDWTCVQGTLNSSASYSTAHNLLFPAFIVSGSTPHNFYTNYYEPLDLDFHYLYTGSSSNTSVSFRFNNSDPVTFGVVTGSFDQVNYEIFNTGGTLVFSGSFTENTWVNISVALQPGFELVIHQKENLAACINNCNNKHAYLEWKCGYADSYSLCQNCPVDYCDINYAIDYNTNKAKLQLTRLEPEPFATAAGNDDALWDNSCPGDLVHWKYEMANLDTPGTGISKLVKFALSYGWQGNNNGLKQLTHIPKNSISYQINNCPTCTVVTDVSTYVTNPPCSLNVNDYILGHTLAVANVTPGATIIFEFDTYKCCEDDPTLYNSPKYFNQWYLRARGEECNGYPYNVPVFQQSNATYNHSQTLRIFNSNGLSGGFISSHGASDLGHYADIGLNLAFSPTITDMTGGAGGADGSPEQFFVQTLGMIGGYDSQLLGYNSTNNTTMHGILRAKISCDAGLKVTDIANQVDFHYLLDPLIKLTPLACYSSIDPATCQQGDFYVYYDLSQPNASQIINNGSFDFYLTPCCNGNMPAQINYKVYFDILQNYGTCFSDFNSPSVTPGVCVVEPPCSSCCWLPLSFVGDDINLHCPGCLAPGIIVESYKMNRTSLGFTDADNNRIPDGPTAQIINDTYALYPYIKRNYSSYGDKLEDVMRARFQDGDSPGYTYSTMVANGAILDVLQLARDIPNSNTMNLQAESFTFYIDNPLVNNPNPSACLDCDDYGLDPNQFVTVKKLCVTTPAQMAAYLQVYNLSVSDNRYFFTFDLNNINDPLLNCASLPTFNGFSTEQRYRLKVSYKVCGNFTALPNASSITDVRKQSEILNNMWLTGSPKPPSVSGPNLQMPNDETLLNGDGWTSINNTTACAPPCTQINNSFAESYTFYCETFSGNHYFISTNTYSNYCQGSLYCPVGQNSCDQSFLYTSTVKMGNPNFSNLFPYEFKPSALSLTNLLVNIPNSWNLQSVLYRSQFTTTASSLNENLGITSPPGTINITANQIPGLNCLNSTVSNNSVLHYGADEGNSESFEFHFVPTVNCQLPTYNYTYTASDIIATHSVDLANCIGNSNDGCGVSVNTDFSQPISYPSLNVPNPNLVLDFDFTNATNYPVCWTFDLSNLNASNNTNANNSFIAVPVLAFTNNTSWVLTLSNCTGGVTTIPGAIQGGFVFFHIGNIALNTNCSGSLCVNLSNCPVVNGVFNISIGQNCGNLSLLTNPSQACFHAEYPLTINSPQITVTHNETLPASYNLCDNFPVNISITSSNGGVTPSLISLGTLPIDLTLVSCEIYSCNNPLLISQLSSGGGNSFTITYANLDAIGITDHVLSAGDQLCIRIWYNGSCNFNGTLPTVDLSGTNYCGQSFSIPTITFNSMGAPSANNCNCSQPCDGTKFTTSINSCTVDFTAFPANNYANDCDAVMYAWNFNDGSPIPPYSLSNTVTHTFPASGTYTVCMAAICYDIDNGVWKQIEYCKYCEDVVVDCRKDTCKDVKFTSILTDCKIDLTAYAPGMAGCSSIEYEWNYGDGNSSGITTSNTISYTYTTEGTYNLCLTAYCLDEYGRVIATCRYCEEVKPDCKNCGESKLIVRSDQCNASFEASVPGMTNCSYIEYVWYPGDGNVLPASTSNIFNYNYCSSGIYNVCFEANCYDSNSNLLYTCKVCKDVDIKCIEPFCIKVENPLAGSFTGVDIGRQIVSTPDGGYVIVGTVNSNSTTPANTNATNEGDTYFAKFDANNNIEFQLRLGDISGSYYNERGHSVLVRPDGYYVSGLTYKSYGVDHDIQIVKISLNGAIEWGKRYGNNNSRKDDPAKLLDMSANGSGNILVVGSSNNSSTYNSPFDISLTNSDFIAFVIDPSGNQVGVLKKRYNYSSANTESEYARDAIKINIGNGDEYVIAGDYAPCTTTPGCTDRDAYIIKLDANLNVTASQKLSLPSRVETVSSVEFLNGQIIVGGSNQLTGSLEKAWLATLNATNLSVISSVEISNGLNSNSKILGMNKSADNKLLIAGRCTNNSNDDGLGIQLNLNGGYNIDWSVYSNYPTNRDYFSTITENYLVTGLRKEASPFVEEITISKLCAANGLNCCVENLTTVVSPITYSDNGQSYSSSLSLNTTSVLVDIPAYSFPVLCSDNTRLTISSQTMSDGNIVLYPNPNTGKFTIKSLNENLSILKIIIRDFSGREIYNVDATMDNIKSYVVDRELNWNSGLYSVVIIDSDDQKHTYKISILK